MSLEFRYHAEISPIADVQEKSKEWALENAENQEPNLDKIAAITNRTPVDIHCIMDEYELEIDLLPLHWLPQNTVWFEMRTEKEQNKIEKESAYVTNAYISDSGYY